MHNHRHSAFSVSGALLRGLTLVVIMLLASGCSGLFGGPSPQPDVFSVSGVVHEGDNLDRVIADATVRIGSRHTVSDEHGRYALADIAFADALVTLTVSADGFVDASLSLHVEAGRSHIANVGLMPLAGGSGGGDEDETTNPGEEPAPGNDSGDRDPGPGDGTPGGGDEDPHPGDREPIPGEDDGPSVPPTPVYEGQVAVSIRLANTSDRVETATETTPAVGRPLLRPVAAVRQTAVDDFLPGEWIVEIDRARGVQPINLLWAEVGVQLVRQLSDGFYLVTAPETEADVVEARLASMPAVASYGRNRLVSPIAADPVVPNDEYYFRQWSLPLISAPDAWRLTTGSRRVVVAVLDTGIASHGDIDAGRIVAGRNFVGDQSATDYRDKTTNFSHGTMVAGIIGARTDNGTGIAGLNWDVTLMPVRVMSSTSGTGTIAGVGDGIQWAVDNGAHIINMSLAWDSNPNDAGERYVRQQIERAAARGVVMIAGAGNDNGSITMPAAHPDVIAVGAVDKYKKRAWYSNYGFELDLTAPGGDQPSDGLYRDGVLSTDVASGQPYYTYSQGTSFASPHVTGVAALMYSRGITDRDEIREILLDTAEDLGAPGYDMYYGHGLVNAYAAVAGVRRTDALVGVATRSGDVVGPVQPERLGDEAVALVPGVAPGRQHVFAWIDVNRDGRLDDGDFAAMAQVQVAEQGVVSVDMPLHVVRTLPRSEREQLRALIHR